MAVAADRRQLQAGPPFGPLLLRAEREFEKVYLALYEEEK